MILPPWFQMNGGTSYAPAPELANKRIRLHFADRTMQAMANLFSEFIVSDAQTRKNGMLQGLDGRAKLLGILLLVVTTSLLHSTPLIFCLLAAALALAFLSRIPPRIFIGKVWIFVFIFAGLIALPATLNLFTPGDRVISLWSFGQAYRLGPYLIPPEITLTRQGISTALLLVSRVATSISLVLLLTLTTPWAEILKALRLLRVPQIYVQTLGMALRYLMLLSKIVEEMHTAKKSRTLRTRKTRVEHRWIADQMGALFKRSMQLSVEVHHAMVARGYQGEVRILAVMKMRKKDYLWMAFCLALAAFFIYAGR